MQMSAQVWYRILPSPLRLCTLYALLCARYTTSAPRAWRRCGRGACLDGRRPHRMLDAAKNHPSLVLGGNVPLEIWLSGERQSAVVAHVGPLLLMHCLDVPVKGALLRGRVLAPRPRAREPGALVLRGAVPLHIALFTESLATVGAGEGGGVPGGAKAGVAVSVLLSSFLVLHRPAQRAAGAVPALR